MSERLSEADLREYEASLVDAPDHGVFNMAVTNSHMRKLIAGYRRSLDIPELVEAVVNLLIAIEMGWDLEGTIDVVQNALAKHKGEAP